jgi:hypothetical protein
MSKHRPKTGQKWVENTKNREKRLEKRGFWWISDVLQVIGGGARESLEGGMKMGWDVGLF